VSVVFRTLKAMMVVAVLMILVVLFLWTAPGNTADRVDGLTTTQLAKEARKVVRQGGIHSSRWGDASPYLRRLSYELIERAFRPYGTDRWALYIANRESGFNPGAINSSSYCTGLAQFSPIHKWINFRRLIRDPAYAVAVFLHMSRGGRETGPWRL